jgi:small subunit ribosomal protein S2
MIEEASRCGMPYRLASLARRHADQLPHRASSRSTRLKDLETMKPTAVPETGQEGSAELTREMERLERSLGGIKNMNALPDAMFVIDVGHEEIAMARSA